MIEHTLTDFIWQVRRNNRTVLFPLLRDQQFEAVYIRPYNTQIGETDRLANSMGVELSFVSLINDIASTLEHEDIPRNKHLEEYIRNLHKIFSGYSTEGPYAGRYFIKILSFLEGFLSFIRLNHQRDDEMLAHLQSIGTGNQDLQDTTAENLLFYVNYKNRKAKKLHEYHHIFNDFLQQETEKHQGIKVTTRTEQCLMTLTDMIRQSIHHSQSAMELIEEFKSKVMLAEKQEQYN
jgi:hypothetical protein